MYAVTKARRVIPRFWDCSLSEWDFRNTLEGFLPQPKISEAMHNLVGLPILSTSNRFINCSHKISSPWPRLNYNQIF